MLITLMANGVAIRVISFAQNSMMHAMEYVVRLISAGAMDA